MNVIIIKAQIFHKIKYDFKVSQGNFYVMERWHDFLFSFSSSDLMTTLTYVFMENFYPCFF